MKILVTGGAGFIGSNLIRYIIEHTDHCVMNLDCLTYAGNLDSLNDVKDNPRYKFYNATICNQIDMLNVLKKYQPDKVMHLAAESHVDRSIEGPSDFIDTNIKGTFSLLEAVRNYFDNLDKNDKEQFRFHHISTDEVYGDLDCTDDLFTENTPYSPS